MIFISNRYTRIYHSIIERARHRSLPKSVYVESHHIIPRSLGGSDEINNLVKLTYKEHRVCHKLLVKMTQGKAKGKMSYALLFFKIDDTTKQTLVKAWSDYRKGFIPITNGNIDRWISKEDAIPDGFRPGFSPATIKKHGDGNKGKKWITDGIVSYQIKEDILPDGFYWGQADYHKQKNSVALSKEGNPMFGKFGKEHPAYDYQHTENMRKHLSITKTGSKNPMYGKTSNNAKPIEINGIKYNSMTEARVKTGLSRRIIENLYKGIIK